MKRVGSIRREIYAVLITAVFLVPIYFIVINSIKPYREIMVSFIALPKSLHLINFKEAWAVTRYGRTFFNSLFVTSFSVAGIVILSSMAAYKLQRTKTKYSTVVYYLITFAMLIPFPSIMIPMVKITANIGIINKLYGLIVIYWGLNSTLAVFTYHGFIKSIPLEIEEAAKIDGCNDFRLFFQIVFPLLKPITVTILVLNVLWIWNDFLMPMLVIRAQELKTIPLMLFDLWGNYVAKWNIILPAILIAIAPSVLFFFFMQRHIVKGVSLGSVKG